MPDVYNETDLDDDQVVGDVWNMTDGPTRPFIFSIDKDTTGNNAETVMMFSRFAQDKLEMAQVANDVFNVKMAIEEEF